MTRMRCAAALALLLVSMTGCTASPPDPTASPPVSAAPVDPTPLPSTAPEPSASAPRTPVDRGVDTSAWVPYVSEHYGLRLRVPPDWRIFPATREWSLEDDAGVIDSQGHDGFLSAGGDFVISVWAARFQAPATLTAIQTWTERYCSLWGGSDCATIGERAIRLCNGRQDCDPGLLVEYSDGIEAYFTDAQRPGQLIVVVSWRPPSWQVVDPTVIGTSREILHAFLSTMDVWPQP